MTIETNFKEEEQHLDHHVQLMQTHICTSSLEHIAKQLNLTKYYDLWKDVTKDISLDVKHSTIHRTLLTYEGGLYTKCTEQEARALFLASLLYYNRPPRKSKELFEEIHALVSEKKQVSENVFNLTTELLLLDITKPITLKDKVFCDALKMMFYTWDLVLLQNALSLDFSKFTAANKKKSAFAAEVSFQQWLSKQSGVYASPNYKTNWARVKAFKLNLPQMVKNRIGILLSQIEYTPGML